MASATLKPQTPDTLAAYSQIRVGTHLCGTSKIGQLVASSPFKPQTPDQLP